MDMQLQQHGHSWVCSCRSSLAASTVLDSVAAQILVTKDDMILLECTGFLVSSSPSSLQLPCMNLSPPRLPCFQTHTVNCTLSC